MNRKKLRLIIFIVVIALLGASLLYAKTADVKSGEDVIGKRYEMFKQISEIKYIIDNYFVSEEPVTNEKLIKGAIKGMVDSLGDQHTSYFTKEELDSFEEDISGEYAGVGMVVGKKDKILSVVSPIEDTPAYKAGMRTNDYILEIDGKSTVDLSIEECVKLLKGKPNTTVKIVVAREGMKKPFDVVLTRAIIKLKYVKQKMVQGNIGYVRLTQFGEGVTADVRKAVDELVNSGAKGIILDLRNNPGGTLLDAVGISSIFIDGIKNQEGKMEKAVIVSTKDKKGKVEVFRSIASENNKAYTDLPMIIMINEGSASASEIVSGAIKDHKRGILLGEKSYGKGSVQQMIPLKDGDGIKMTIAKYYTPSGVCIDHKGIEPDVKVEEEEDYALYEGMVTNVVEEKQEKSVTESAVTTAGAVEKDPKAKKDDKQLNTAIGILKGLIIYGRK